MFLWHTYTEPDRHQKLNKNHMLSVTNDISLMLTSTATQNAQYCATSEIINKEEKKNEFLCSALKTEGAS